MNEFIRKGSKAAGFLAALLLGGGALSAQESALQIMTKVYERPQSSTMSAQLVMETTNARGSTRERSLQQYSLDEGSTERRLMFFTAPADVRGTSFMTWSYEDGRRDDQWIYLPALSRVRRIAADKQNESFMGSDFTYEDLSPRHPNRDEHTLVREEVLNGQACFVVESRPKEAGDSYARTLSWIVKDSWVGLRREFYDAAGTEIRRLEVQGLEESDGFWIITEMTMHNLAAGSRTRMRMQDVDFSGGLQTSFFTERQMRLGAGR